MGLWVGGADLWGVGRSQDPWRKRQDRPVTTATVTVAALWRWLACGLAAGAVGGTFVFPILGTIIGAVLGLVGSVVPAVLAAIVLRLAIRPGMGAAIHRRVVARVHLGLMVVAGAICVVVAASWLQGDSGAAGSLAVGLAVTLVSAVGFLWWAGWTLIGLGPPVAPAWRRHRRRT